MMTLPGCPESLNPAGGRAKAGATVASAIIRSEHLVRNFIVSRVCAPDISKSPAVLPPFGHLWASVAIRFTPETDPNRKFDLTSLDARTGHLSAAHSITSSARTRSDCG